MDGHFPNYSQNYADGTTLVRCSCGWTKTAEREDVPAELHTQHLVDLTLLADQERAPAVETDPTVADMSLARFRRAEHPQGINPITALDAAKAWCLAQDDDSKPQHILIFVGRSDANGGSQTNFFQAGEYHTHAQFGLAHSGMTVMRREAK